MVKASDGHAAATNQPVPGPLFPLRRPGTAGQRSKSFPQISLQILGRQVGIDPTYAGRIMNGRVRPSMAVAERLAAIMGWTLDQVNALYQGPREERVVNAKSRNQRPKRSNGAGSSSGSKRRNKPAGSWVRF
jgi:hypothetical protein